ncbi:UNVERIFIED_ORG: ectoine hydroxylase-related dioxygenase (phytanoyl-CoA dioxygenase family) [Burkholderia sp. CF145]
MTEIKKHGITEQETKDFHMESLDRVGFFVLKGAVSKAKVEEIRVKLYAAYEAQIAEVGGEENLKKIKDDGIARALFAYDPIFIKDVLCNSATEPYLAAALDTNYTLYSQVGVFSKPRNELYQVAWHREVQYQHFTVSRPLAVQTLFILNDFNEETGGTYFLPSSHLFEKFPSDEFVLRNQVQPVLEPGDIVVMNSMLYHRAGVNRSNADRLLITNTFTRPIMASQFDYTSMIDPATLTDNERQILGFRWNHSLPMRQWRLNRINSI